MPAQGRGAFLTPRAPAKPPPKPAPPPPPPPHRAALPPVFAGHLPQQPFAAAQHHAARAVAQAQAREPVRAVPHIPRLPNPTPAQSHAALQLAAQAQRRAVGPAPTAAQIRAYQREVATDPRLREYRDTVAHYARALEGHEAAVEGRTAPQEPSRGPQGLARPLSRAALPIGLGELAAALVAPQQTAKRLREADVAQGRAQWAARAPFRGEAEAGKAPSSLHIPFADIKIPTGKLAAAVSGEIAKLAPGLASATPETAFVKNALSDAKQIGTLPFLGTVATTKAGVAALQGNLTPAKQLASGVAQGIEQGAVGQLVQGNLAGVGAAVRQHPLFSLTEALGASGIAGRTAGALTRAVGSTPEEAGLRGSLARAGSRVRHPIGLTEESGLAERGLVHQREYSGDLIRSALQHAADARRRRVLDAGENPVKLRERGRVVEVLAPKNDREARQLQRNRENYRASTAQATERGQREVARKLTVQAGTRASRRPGPVDVQPRLVKGAARPLRLAEKKLPVKLRAVAEELVPLVSEGVIATAATWEADVRKRLEAVRSAIAKPGEFNNVAELDQARANERLLQAALHPKILAQKDAIVAEGLAQAPAHRAADEALIRAHIYPRQQVERSQLTTYAVARMGARHVSEEEHKQLEKEAAAAGKTREEQLAVSGFHPERALLHEQAKVAHRAAQQAVKVAQEDVRRASEGRGRAVGEARRAPRNRPLSRLTGAERRAKEAGATTLQVAEGRLRGAKERLSEARKQEKVQRENLRRTPMPPRLAGIRGPGGEFLSNEEIRAHATKAGRDPKTLIYLPHRLNPEDARSYHRQLRVGSRPSNSGDELRTYAMFNRGANTISHKMLRDELTSKLTTVERAGQIDKMIRESGARHPLYRELVHAAEDDAELTRGQKKLIKSQGYLTEKEGAQLAEKLAKDGQGEFVPVRAFSSKAPEADRLRSELRGATIDTSHLGLLNHRLIEEPSASGIRNVVLVPKTQVDQLLRHLHPAGELERFAQMLNLPFRMAVLPQPRWLTGNFLEPFVIRLPLSGSGINLPGLGMDLLAAHRVVRRLEAGNAAEQQAARQIRQMHFQGLFVGRKGASVRRTYEDFEPGVVRGALHGGHILFKELPVTKQMASLVLTLPRAFFHINRLIEASAQRAAFGKSVRRDIQQFTGNWHETVLLGKQAVDEASRGLVNTATQHRFMRAQHELLGQYDAFRPGLRRSVQTVTPFLPWTLASLRFVYWTLPAHHTVAFDGLLKAGQAVQSEWEAAHKDVPPGTLRAALPAKDGGLIDVARYTPYGVTQPLGELGDKGVRAGEATEGITGTLLPQVSGALEALQGRDPFGRELQVPGGKASGGQELGIALNQLLEGLVPLLAIGRRLREGGGTGYSNSTIFSPKVKPGTKHQGAVVRTLDPFRETYLKQPASAAPKGSLTEILEHESEQSSAGSPLERILEEEAAHKK